MTTYDIPISSLRKGERLCFLSATDFWTTAKHAAEIGSMNIALGLLILSLEEIGKFRLLRESFGRRDNGAFPVIEKEFKAHRLKLEKAMIQLEDWGFHRPTLPLRRDERERIWFVNWDPNKKELTRESTPTIMPVLDVEELVRLALVKMNALTNEIAA
jgi:AbiV family abortive infection protein